MERYSSRFANIPLELDYQLAMNLDYKTLIAWCETEQTKICDSESLSDNIRLYGG